MNLFCCFWCSLSGCFWLFSLFVVGFCFGLWCFFSLILLLLVVFFSFGFQSCSSGDGQMATERGAQDLHWVDPLPQLAGRSKKTQLLAMGNPSSSDKEPP